MNTVRDVCEAPDSSVTNLFIIIILLFFATYFQLSERPF